MILNMILYYSWISMSMPNKPVLENINNSVLSGRSAMPQKAQTSANENQFSMNRVIYAKTINSLLAETVETNQQKHFYGGKNHDASSVIQRRTILNVGYKNKSGHPFSYQGAKNANDVRQAQKKVRNSGSAVPAKKTHKYEGAPIFY